MSFFFPVHDRTTVGGRLSFIHNTDTHYTYILHSYIVILILYARVLRILYMMATDDGIPF